MKFGSKQKGQKILLVCAALILSLLSIFSIVSLRTCAASRKGKSDTHLNGKSKHKSKSKKPKDDGWNFKNLRLRYDKKKNILHIGTNVTDKTDDLNYSFYWKERLKNESGKINNPQNLSSIEWKIPSFGEYKITVQVSDKTSKEQSNSKNIGVMNPKMRVPGIDVSCWQKHIDWNKVSNSGVKFAMIRTGYGRNIPKQVDSYFAGNYDGAKKAGLDVGVYHYSYAKSVEDAVNEAKFCLSIIDNRKLEYPVSFDIEDASLKKLGKRALTDICAAFCEEIKKAGYLPSIYSNGYYIDHYLYAKELFPKYDLWFSNWNAYPCKYCQMWQYSDKGKISGISEGSGFVDENFSYKDYPKYVKENHLNKY